MTLIQLSAGAGPAECCLAVRKALARLCYDAAAAGIGVALLEQVDGPLAGTVRSVLLQLDGTASGELASRWSGTMLWICASPYRARYPRKNWFFSGAACDAPALPAHDGAIRYQATRASGPGGQHVNKTDSAIRAIHVASGLSVKVQSGRSQHANKRLAAQLLTDKLAQLAGAAREDDKSARHRLHRQAERGNARRVFSGPDFKEQQ